MLPTTVRVPSPAFLLTAALVGVRRQADVYRSYATIAQELAEDARPRRVVWSL